MGSISGSGSFPPTPYLPCPRGGKARILAWTEEPGGLQSMGWQRARNEPSTAKYQAELSYPPRGVAAAGGSGLGAGSELPKALGLPWESWEDSWH